MFNQCRHGAIQETSFTGVEETPSISAPPRRRNACAPAASTTISTMSAYTARHPHVLRDASAIFHLEIISRIAPLSSRWESGGRKNSACPKDKLTATVYNRRRRGVLGSGKKIPQACPSPASSASRAAPTISGRMGGHTGTLRPPARRFSTTTATRSGADRRGSPETGRRPFLSRSGNLVFMQFEQVRAGRAPIRLPKTVDRYRRRAWSVSRRWLQGQARQLRTSICSSP